MSLSSAGFHRVVKLKKDKGLINESDLQKIFKSLQSINEMFSAKQIESKSEDKVKDFYHYLFLLCCASGYNYAKLPSAIKDLLDLHKLSNSDNTDLAENVKKVFLAGIRIESKSKDLRNLAAIFSDFKVKLDFPAEEVKPEIMNQNIDVSSDGLTSAPKNSLSSG